MSKALLVLLGVLFSISVLFNVAQYKVLEKCIEDKLHTKSQDKQKEILKEFIQMHNSRIGKGYSDYLAAVYIKAGKEFNINPFLLVSLSKPESNFNHRAVSYMGARGIMQVMPFWTNHIDFVKTPDDLHDPEINIRAGAYILRLYTDQCGPGEAAIRCYHGGPRAVHAPRPETVTHSQNVMRIYNSFISI